MNRGRIKPMTPGISHGARIRAYLAAIVVSAGLTGVAWRAWGLQVTSGDRYRALATRQHELTVHIPAPRGEIIDVHGRPLAVTADADSIWANPREIRDVTAAADRLSALLGGDAAALEAKLGGDHRFAWLARQVTPALAQKVRDAKLPGIEVGKEPRRWYPARAVGGTVIGRSDIDGNGVDGIELALNAQLIGERGAGLALRDVRGKRMFADGFERPQAGATVQLSLDATIQAIAESAIADAVRIKRARAGVVVAIDIATGRVVAMASAPSYDPNAPRAAASGDRDHEPARNRAVTDAYEAGSVMKVFSIAAAVDDGTVTPDTEFDLNGGTFRVGNTKAINDVEHDASLTVAGIIKRSSNVGAAKIALRFGSAKLYAALRRFGFGTRTGIELPGEQIGMLRDGAHWRDRDLASIAFGYGLTVTPLQVAAAIAAFGNRGVYREPRIVERIVDADGTVLYEPQQAERRVVSERTAAQMLTMLAAVFEGGKLNGTASTIVVPGFRCAGKTGTANKYDPESRGYAAHHYLSSFAGIAPLDHPRLAIVAMVDDPLDGDHFGAKVAGPVFARLASEALRYLGVPGESTVCPPSPPGAPPSSAPKTCLPAPSGKPGDAAPAVSGARPSAQPSDEAMDTPSGARGHGPAGDDASPSSPRATAKPGAPPAEAALPPGVAAVLAPLLGSWAAADARAGTGDAAPDGPITGSVEIPDFHGMGIARAIAAAREAHLAIATSGTGRVIEQRPPPGPSSALPQVWLRLSDDRAAAASRP